MEKKICKECGIEKNTSKDFYSIHGTKMIVCKECFIDEFMNAENGCNFFRKYDLPFIYDLWEAVLDECSYDQFYSFKKYIQKLNLPQFRLLRWKNSKLNKGESEYEMTFNEENLLNLKQEIRSLNGKIKNARENNDIGTYKNLIIAYKEVLRLIYDLERQEGKLQNTMEYNSAKDNDNKDTQILVESYKKEEENKNYLSNLLNNIIDRLDRLEIQVRK